VNRSGIHPSPVFLGILAAAVAGGVLTVLGSQTATEAGTLLLVLGGWGVSLCLHEFGHAYVAYRGGDRAVRAKGYLTLDIRRYTDPVLSLVLPLLFLVIGGIPLPGGAVWINHHALRSRKAESLVSLAGPLANLALGILLSVAVKFAFPIDTLTALPAALSFLALLQILAFVLNILPIPGLDGWGAIEPWLSFEARQFGAKVRPWAPFVLFALVLWVRPFQMAFFTVATDLFVLVGGNQNLAGAGHNLFFFWQH